MITAYVYCSCDNIYKEYDFIEKPCPDCGKENKMRK